MRIRLDHFDRRNFADVQQLTVVNPMGMPLQVSQFADIQRGNAPSLLERKDRQPAVTLTADALGRPSGSVADDVVAYIKDHPLPDGMGMAWGSDIKRQDESFGALGSVLLISFILIYLILEVSSNHSRDIRLIHLSPGRLHALCNNICTNCINNVGDHGLDFPIHQPNLNLYDEVSHGCQNI